MEKNFNQKPKNPESCLGNQNSTFELQNPLDEGSFPV